MICDLWSSIKKTPSLFIFMFTQVIITSLILYIVIADYYWINEQNNSAQIAWGNKEYVKLFFKDNVPWQDRASLTFSMPGMMASSEEEYQNNLLKFQKVEDFYNELNRLEYITVIPNQHNFTITLETEKAWNEDDKKYGTHNFFSDNGNNVYNILNTFFIGSNYLEYFNVKLSEGIVFTKEDYLYDGDFIPVIMGSSYRQYYSLNEEFNASLGTNMTQEKFKVIGFIAENQYYSPVNLTGVGNTVFSYDNQILIPYCERDLNDLLTDSYKRLMFLFTSRANSAFFIIDQDKYDVAIAEIEKVLSDTGLGEYYRPFKCRIEKELASNYQDKLTISIAVCIAALLFSLFSFIFTMLYKIDDNIKNYAIRMVVGETYIGIALRYLFESFIVFLFGQMTGFFAFKIYAVNSYIYQGYDYLEAPTLRTGILLNLAFYILTAVILYICVNVKLKTYSLATLIRGNEVKKERRMPFYRAVIFLMLAIVGVFGMFIASYQVALDRIDIYYNSYYTKNVKMAYVNPFAVEGAPDVKAKCDEICENVNDAIINKYISTGYKGDDFIEERGLYFNGYIDPVNMLEGRFFTHEEVSGKDKIAVVGKDIYEKYVTVNDKGEKVYHSEDLDADLLVIGVMGKEDQATSIDLTVFTPLRVGTEKFGSAGSYTLDGKDKGTVEKLAEAFEKYVSETGMVSLRDYHPRITVEAPTDTLLMLLILIIINAIVFCFYYVSKQGHIHAVKKIVGYSKTMIISDTFADFLVLTLGAFVTGNAIVILLKETLFRNVQLFSIYMIDPQVIVMTLIAVVLLTVFLSVIAVTKTFAVGNSNEYRV